jgi:hypothetical protein
MENTGSRLLIIAFIERSTGSHDVRLKVGIEALLRDAEAFRHPFASSRTNMQP